MQKHLLKLAFLLSITPLQLAAQDTVRLMTYNILNYPYVAATRADTLKIIIDDVLPDIFIIQELQNNTGANAILNNAMNASGRTHYDKAIFYNGTASDNMCYWDNTKFGLASQRQISTVLRDISEYVLYWKGNLPTSDTIYFNVYSCHLKAGSSASDENQRYSEAQDLKDRLDERTNMENVFVGGDFNLYSNSEPAWTEITSGGNVDLYDPINMAGDWHVNATYADIHTQATGSINGGSGGGLDDRFDFIFVTSDIMLGNAHVRYIDGTYKAYGQDGNRFNSDLNVWPANTEVSAEIASALYNMSDHLPVIMDVVIDPTLSIEVTDKKNWNFFYAPGERDLVFNSSQQEKTLSITVNDLLGKNIISTSYQSTNQARIPISGLQSGVYLATVKSGQMHYSIKFVVH